MLILGVKWMGLPGLNRRKGNGLGAHECSQVKAKTNGAFHLQQKHVQHGVEENQKYCLRLLPGWCGQGLVRTQWIG
jgi:hypothetical protein